MAMYGHISDWDTSAVTHMGGVVRYGGVKGLFQDEKEFDEDLSRWDVGYMFWIWEHVPGLVEGRSMKTYCI